MRRSYFNRIALEEDNINTQQQDQPFPGQVQLNAIKDEGEKRDPTPSVENGDPPAATSTPAPEPAKPSNVTGSTLDKPAPPAPTETPAPAPTPAPAATPAPAPAAEDGTPKDIQISDGSVTTDTGTDIPVEPAATDPAPAMVEPVEPNDPVTPVTADPVVAEPSVSEEDKGEALEDGILKAHEEAEEADLENDQLDATYNDMEALESIHDAIAYCVKQNGRINPHAANITDIAIESIFDRCGIAMESDKDKPRGLEYIKQQIVRIWEAIVKTLKRIIAWTKTRYESIWGTAELLKKRIKATKSIVQKLPTEAAEKSEFDSAMVFKRLHRKGVVASTTDDLRFLTMIAEEIFEKHSEKSQQFGEELLRDLKEVAKGQTIKTDLVLSMHFFTQPLATSHKLTGMEVPEHMVLYRTDELPGGKAVFSCVEDPAVVNPELVKKVEFYLAEFDSKADDPTPSPLKTLDRVSMMNFLEMIDKIADLIKKYKSTLEKNLRMKEEAVAIAGSFMEKANKIAELWEQDNIDRKQQMKNFATYASHFPRLLDEPAASFSVYCLGTCKAFVDYVELSAKQFKAPTPKTA